ncbi:MAG: hypothetical protein QOH49_3548 [Acidobacteriota bacterium]|nr:hypothetical protein [Acidobacteriota bacterium]
MLQEIPYGGTNSRSISALENNFRNTTVLSRILSMTYENGIVDGNPMSRVKRLREPEPRQRYLNLFSDDEEERLMKALAGYGEHVVALSDLDLEVGMRLGELLNASGRMWMRIANSSLSRRRRMTSRI